MSEDITQSAIGEPEKLRDPVQTSSALDWDRLTCAQWPANECRVCGVSDPTFRRCRRSGFGENCPLIRVAGRMA